MGGPTLRGGRWNMALLNFSLVQGLLVAWHSSLRIIFYFWIKHSAKLKNPSLKLPSLAKRLRLIMLGWFVWIRTSIHYGRRRRSHWAILPKPALSLVNLRVLFQKLCLEMAFFRNFKYVFWRLQTRCLKFENCFGITGLILLKWDTVQHDPSLGEKVEFSLVTDLWPRWPNKHVVHYVFVWSQIRHQRKFNFFSQRRIVLNSISF